MAQPKLAEAAREMRATEHADFFINESVRISRFAGRLADAGQHQKAAALLDIAKRLGEIACQ